MRLVLKNLAKVILGGFGVIGMIGQLEHPMKIRDGVVDEPFLHQADPAMQVSVGVIRSDQHELSEIGQRPIKVAALGSHLAALKVRRRELRVALDGTVEIGQSPDGIAHLVVDQAAAT